MGYFSTGWRRYLTAAVGGSIVAIMLLAAGWVFFPRVPAASAVFDCDDGALAMYRHFRSVGFSVQPIIGDLERDDEAYGASDHVWLLVNVMGREIAWDWGLPRFDRQHYEGYPITIDDLLAAVAADGAGGSSAIAAAR